MARLKPLYAVLFSTEDNVDAPYSPIVLGAPGVPSAAVGTQPHGLDADVIGAIPGLWYCLHLPATFFDYLDLCANVIKTSQALDQAHQIVLWPIEAFDSTRLGSFPPWTTPALVVCPDDLAADAQQRSTKMGFPLAVARYSELSNESVNAHWRAIHKAFIPDVEYIGREPSLMMRMDTAPTLLPTLRIARQFGRETTGQLLKIGLNEAIAFAGHHQTLLAAIADLERAGVPAKDAEVALEGAAAAAAAALAVPVAATAVGVSSAYERQTRVPQHPKVSAGEPGRATASAWVRSLAASSDAGLEASVGAFLSAHRSIARGGVGLNLPPIPPVAFGELAQLESHCRGNPVGRKVLQMLDRISDAVVKTWSESLVSVLSHASSLIAFTDFPIGLVRLPGDSDPLGWRVPIAYQPLTPMTRALQNELQERPAVYLDEGFRVLVAECIPEADSVGSLSREGWNVARRMFIDSRVEFNFVETLTIDAFKQAIAEHRPDILVVSAHGFYDGEGSAAGLVIGQEFTIGIDLGELPPVVLLSACTTAPRGRGAVSVADLLVRQGAMAVLSTQVPVDVRRDAILMARLFVNMLEVVSRGEPERTLLDVWHRTRATNAINDVLSGSPSLTAWGQSRMANGNPVIYDFMSSRSEGRLRVGSVYRDTELVLSEMARDCGLAAPFTSWIRQPGYVPESMFYTFVGRPDRIHLASPVDFESTSLAEIRVSASRGPVR